MRAKACLCGCQLRSFSVRPLLCVAPYVLSSGLGGGEAASLLGCHVPCKAIRSWSSKGVPVLHGRISSQNTFLYVCLFSRYLAPRHLIQSSMGWACILTPLLAGSRHSVHICRMCACVSVCVCMCPHVCRCLLGTSGTPLPLGHHFCGCVVHQCHVGHIKRAFYEREHRRKHYS